MEVNIKDFWERINNILKDRKESLKSFSDGCQISNQKIKNWRYQCIYPKAEDLISISEYLHVSIDWLLLGKDTNNLSPEALLVENNLTYRQLIRGCEEIPELLPALTSLLQVGRKEEIEKPS